MRRGSVMLPAGGFNVMSSGPGEALGVDEEKLQPLKPGRSRRGSGVELSLPEDKSAAELVKSRRNSANVEDLQLAEGRRRSALQSGWRQMFDVDDRVMPASGVDDALLAARAALPAGGPTVSALEKGGNAPIRSLIRLRTFRSAQPNAQPNTLGRRSSSAGSRDSARVSQRGLT